MQLNLNEITVVEDTQNLNSLLNDSAEQEHVFLEICKNILSDNLINQNLRKLVESVCKYLECESGEIRLNNKENKQILNEFWHVNNIPYNFPLENKSQKKIDSIILGDKRKFDCIEYNLDKSGNNILITFFGSLPNDITCNLNFYFSKKTNDFYSKKILFLHFFTAFLYPILIKLIDQSHNTENCEDLEINLKNNFEFTDIIGNHPKILDILEIVSQVANTDATVLIQGDCGTGKELIARALYNNSKRKNKPFLPINCGAIPESLLESELFGHVRGAFTGAYKDTQGWFEKADHGTIFLDEVSKMSPALQVKLLRILQTGEYSLVGSAKVKHCNVRIIAASDKDLIKLVKENKFREDLLYRLNVITIDLPSLKERKSDILKLAYYFLKKFSEKYNKIVFDITSETKALLLAYDYPGNIRELENAIERAILFTKGTVIESYNLPACMQNDKQSHIVKGKATSFREGKEKVICEYERNYLTECLKVSNGNISLGSKIAGIDVKNFYVKMKKHMIDPHIFKLQN